MRAVAAKLGSAAQSALSPHRLSMNTKPLRGWESTPMVTFEAFVRNQSLRQSLS